MDGWWEFPSNSTSNNQDMYLVGPMEGLYKMVEGGGIYGEMIQKIWGDDEDIVISEAVVDRGGRVMCLGLSTEGITYLYIFEHDELVCQLAFPDAYVPLGLHGMFKSDPPPGM